MTIHNLTSTEARAQIYDLDAVTQRIAEYLWIVVNENPEDARREWNDSEPFDGQWNFCVEDAKKLSNLFGEMILEATSS